MEKQLANLNQDIETITPIDDTEQIKENLAQNILYYRKRFGLTQVELADKLNYSDKSVSKWERGEAIPDIATLKKLANFFNVTIDELISKPKTLKSAKKMFNKHKKRAIICALSTILVWLVAVVTYSFMNMIYPPLIDKAWLTFIVALPITFIVVLVFSSIWGKNVLNMIFSSLLSWTTILAIYILLANLLVTVSSTLWMIFLIGIPLQILIILWFSMKIFK